MPTKPETRAVLSALPKICGLGELLIATPETGQIIAHVGSSVCVAAWDPLSKTGAMLHSVLPSSELNAFRASSYPAVFADTGLATLWQALEDLGLDTQLLRFHVAGGAAKTIDGDPFRIGARNLEAVDAFFNEKCLRPDQTHCQGHVSRKVSLNLQTGGLSVQRESGPH
jgi:chemotaxis receptor (MCP) glutamine deamidase CheD